MATNRQWTAGDGQAKEDTQFHRIVAWDKLAKLSQKLLLKGSKVYLEGRLQTNKFVDANGVDRESTEIVVDDFILLSQSSPKVPEDVKIETTVEEVTTTVEV